MAERFHAMLERLATDAAVGVVLLTGAGRAFCVGADIDAIPEGPGSKPPL